MLTIKTISSVMVTDNFWSPKVYRFSSCACQFEPWLFIRAADPDSPYYGSKNGMQFSNYRSNQEVPMMLLAKYRKTLGQGGFGLWGPARGLW